jgi:hypothetical protein
MTKALQVLERSSSTRDIPLIMNMKLASEMSFSSSKEWQSVLQVPSKVACGR